MSLLHQFCMNYLIFSSESNLILHVDKKFFVSTVEAKPYALSEIERYFNSALHQILGQ